MVTLRKDLFILLIFPAKNTCLHYMALAEDRPSWTPFGEVDERCPGLSLILGYKPKVDLTNGYKETALLKAVKCNKPQAKHVVELLVNSIIKYFKKIERLV